MTTAEMMFPPVGELAICPARQLLQAKDVRPVCAGEAHHLLEIRLAFGSLRVAVKDVPGANEKRQSAASVGACFVAAVSQM